MSQTSPPPANGGPTARLLLSAPDRPGLVAAVANFIYSYGGDVTQADQHNDEEEGMFFQRVEFRLDNFKLSRRRTACRYGRTGRAPQYELERCGTRTTERRVAVSSRANLTAWSTCSGRWYAHELPGPARPGGLQPRRPRRPRRATSASRTTTYRWPATPGVPGRGPAPAVGDRPGRAGRIGPLHADPLARVIDAYPYRVINIHHSFLPAFSGGGLTTRRTPAA